MRIPSAAYGALGGAVAASLVWIAAKPQHEIPPPSQSPAKVSPQRPADVSALQPHSQILPTPISPPPSARDATTQRRDSHRSTTSVSALNLTRPAARPNGNSSSYQSQREPTHAELQERTAVVEEAANAQLEALASRLGLSEEQQDRIFPILASASPAFHPIMQPEGGAAVVDSGGTGEIVFGDGSKIEPGAPIAEVENAIYPELDEVQQANLEEDALDREAWWEDVVGQLEEDLESSTSPAAVAETGEDTAAPSTGEFTGEEREAAGQTEQIGGFSNLFGN